jgi:hypothetical protein
MSEELQTKHGSLLNQQKYGIEEIMELQKKNAIVSERIDELR